jgi:hypothetical protein
VAFAASWASGFPEPDALLRLLELRHLEGRPRGILRDVLEPVLHAAAEPRTRARLERLDSEFRYLLYLSACRRSGDADFRRLTNERVAAVFPLQERVRRFLGDGARRVLMVQNIRDSQGDEIIRTVPLLQALLDSNPRLSVVLVTGRAYLYAHPRIVILPPVDRLAIRPQLAAGFDAVIDFYEGNVQSVNYDRDLEIELQVYRRDRPLKLFLAADKGFNQFTFHTFEWEGRPYAQERGLDRQRVKNVYETTFRLAAELGLPVRTGREVPESESVLAGVEWPLAESEWRRLTQHNVEQRLVALLNPFGGGEALKGYVPSQTNALSTQIRRLIGEGFFVIVVPNGTAWGTESHAREAVARLDGGLARFVAVAPDAGADRGRVAGYGGSGLSYADTVTRLLTYFVRFASVIVAVEGWMIHAAYCLGKPYRILMLAYSHPPEWQPYAQRRDQQIDWPMQACASDNGDLLNDFLLEQPRKFTLLALLREFGECGNPLALPFLQRALSSADRDIRAAAAQAVCWIGGPSADRLLAGLLTDSWHRVRGAAASALLVRPLVAPYEELRAHVLIGLPQRDWMQVLALGQAARPALEIALHDEDPVVQREAGWALAFLAAQPRGCPVRRRWLGRGLRSLLPRPRGEPARGAE